MKRKIYSGVYWIAGVTIGLGAFGHGFGGAKALRAALAVPSMIAVFYTIFGVAALIYGRDRFWAVPGAGYNAARLVPRLAAGGVTSSCWRASDLATLED